MTKKLKNELLKVISMHTRYSFDECKAACAMVDSMDALLGVISLAIALGVTPEYATRFFADNYFEKENIE